MDTSDMTELDAVNYMLGTIGEQPVNRLGSGVLEAGIAEEALRMASRGVQAKGWHFNTDVPVTLEPDDDGFINLPGNTTRVRAVGCEYHHRHHGLDLVQRNKRLFNRRTQSFVFDKPVTVELQVMLDFEDLPEFAKRYVAIKAARKFQEQVAASQVLEQFTQQEEYEAKIDMESADAENAGYNIITDNYPNIRTVARRW